MIARFGVFMVDTDRRQLFCGNADVHLTPKAFDLLVLLIGDAPRVIPKAELHARLWPDTFVSDATLVGLVKELRRALKDGPGIERLLRTVHRVGYAFCGSLGPDAGPTALTVAWWVAVGGKHMPLADGAHMVGRDPHASIRIESPNVSRHHARVRVAAAGATIEDLGSKNGTFVLDRRITGVTALSDGTLVQIGTVVLQFHAPRAVASTETTVQRTRG